MPKILEPAYGGHDHFGIGHHHDGGTYAKITNAQCELTTEGSYLKLLVRGKVSSIQNYLEIILTIDIRDENENPMLRIIQQHTGGEWTLDHGGSHEIMLDAGGSEIMERSDSLYIGGVVHSV